MEKIIRCFPCFRLASKEYSRYTDFSKVREIAWVLNHCVQYWLTCLICHAPLFGWTKPKLLLGAQWFLGETRIEVEYLAVIQRKCAKCYQNGISGQQSCIMKAGNKGSFQVTNEGNFQTITHFIYFASTRKSLWDHMDLNPYSTQYAARNCYCYYYYILPYMTRKRGQKRSNERNVYRHTATICEAMRLCVFYHVQNEVDVVEESLCSC